MSDFLDRLLGTTIRCDACGRRFRQRLYDEPRADGGMLRKFQCPRCYQEYPVAVYTKRGYELMNELQNTPASDEKTIKRLRRELKKEVSRP